jgi:hypothetical protein
VVAGIVRGGVDGDDTTRTPLSSSTSRISRVARMELAGVGTLSMPNMARARTDPGMNRDGYLVVLDEPI